MKWNRIASRVAFSVAYILPRRVVTMTAFRVAATVIEPDERVADVSFFEVMRRWQNGQELEA